MHSYIQILIILISVSITSCYRYTFPKNEYEFSMRRDDLKEAELSFAMRHRQMTPDEKIVNRYLEHLKWRHFEETKDTGFLPSRPIEEVQDSIKNSSLYKALKTLPKGGNMHTHFGFGLSRRLLVDIIFNSTLFENLYINNSTAEKWNLDVSINPPNGDWVKVKDSGYTRKRIVEKNTLIGRLTEKAKRYPADSAERWRNMAPIWNHMDVMLQNIEIRKKYLKQLFATSLEEGVQYIEIRDAIPSKSLYEFDKNNGKKELKDDGVHDMEKVKLTLEQIREFQRKESSFIGMKRIVAQHRYYDNEQKIHEKMDSAINLMRKFPDYIKGFDLVGEEDAGNSHLFFLDEFESLYNNKTHQSKLPLFQHTAETSWPDDLKTSSNLKDPVATAQNAYEAILLGSRRVGHGLSYIYHPYLMRILRERDIAIETCPISNQILGYTPDLRKHPAVNFIRNGVPVVLGSDDAGAFGVDDFTLDWYVAYTAWGLNLGDLQQLAMNSLIYSGMNKTEKKDAFHNKWLPKWNEYIAKMKETACNSTFNNTPSFGFVLPKEGALNSHTKVHIYGKGFEEGICNGIQCKFGNDSATLSEYISHQHLTCIAPSRGWRGDQNVVKISVSFDGGNVFINTNMTFTYKYV